MENTVTIEEAETVFKNVVSTMRELGRGERKSPPGEIIDSDTLEKRIRNRRAALTAALEKFFTAKRIEFQVTEEFLLNFERRKARLTVEIENSLAGEPSDPQRVSATAVVIAGYKEALQAVISGTL